MIKFITKFFFRRAVRKMYDFLAEMYEEIHLMRLAIQNLEAQILSDNNEEQIEKLQILRDHLNQKESRFINLIKETSRIVDSHSEFIV